MTVRSKSTITLRLNFYLAGVGLLLVLVAVIGFFDERNEALVGAFLVLGVTVCVISVVVSRMEGQQELTLKGAKLNLAIVKQGENELKSARLPTEISISTESELLLSSRAVKWVQGLGSSNRAEFADALRQAFRGAGNERSLSFEIPNITGRAYRAMAVSGYTVIYRQLTSEELRKQGRTDTVKGYLVFDILPPSLETGSSP